MENIKLKASISLKRMILFGCFAFGLFVFTASAHSAEFYVDSAALDGGDGSIDSPYNSIRTAVDNIRFGEKNVINCTGNFSEYVPVDPGHGGTGESTRTIIQGWPGKPRPVNDARGNPIIYGDIFDLTGYYITLRGFEVIGANNAANIWLGIGSKFVIVEDNISWGAYGAGGSKGICARGSDNAIVRNNEVYGNDEIGIYAPDDSDDIEIYNNVVHDNGRFGIQAVKTGDNVYIHDNHVFHNGYRGPQLHPMGISYASQVPNVATGLVIEHNTIEDEFIGISISDINDAVIRGNTITNAEQKGISLRGPERTVIDGNSIKTLPETWGIFLDSANSTIVQNNILYGEGKTGIFLLGWIPRFDVLNNTIVGQHIGIQVDVSAGAELAKARFHLYNNISYNNEIVVLSQTAALERIFSDNNAFSGYRFFFLRPEHEPMTPEQVCGQFGFDCGSLDGMDPYFVDEESNDYHLLPISPLIGRGLSARAPDQDIDGDDRKADGLVDIGADEYRD